MIQFLQQMINGLSLGSIYALIALGYTMVYGKPQKLLKQQNMDVNQVR